MTNPNEAVAAEALNDLQAMETYEKGWDGHRGVPIPTSVIFTVMAWVTVLAKEIAVPLDSICAGPCSDGSIDLEISFQKRNILMAFDPHYTNPVVCCYDKNIEHFNSFLAGQEFIPTLIRKTWSWLEGKSSTIEEALAA